MEAKHIKHLYHRIGFGITPKKIEVLLKLPKKEVVNQLFNTSKKTTPLTVQLDFNLDDLKEKSKRLALIKKSRKKLKEYNIAWIDRLFNPTELLREKMTLFWANLFVCKDNNIIFVQQYNNLLRENALDNFGTFVTKVAKEPAMLKYLNNRQNVKQNPNENFARELMELFTLGQGNYSEKDIKESARAFTGYNNNFKGEFLLRKKKHDYGEKEFMGKTGNFTGEDIVAIILKQKQCARFISEKIYTYFVNDNINQKHIDEMVSVFYPKYNIKELMQFVLLSDWFYSDENIGVKIKSPVEFLVGMNTIVPFKINNNKHLFLIQKLLGQTLLNPPNVAGWKGGISWIDSNTIVTRLRLPSVLLNNAEISYSDKGEFEDVITNFDEKKLRKKTAIPTTTKWSVFTENYKNVTIDELANSIIATTINSKTQQLLKDTKNVSKQDFCIQLLSLPEYQLC